MAPHADENAAVVWVGPDLGRLAIEFHVTTSHKHATQGNLDLLSFHLLIIRDFILLCSCLDVAKSAVGTKIARKDSF